MSDEDRRRRQRERQRALRERRRRGVHPIPRRLLPIAPLVDVLEHHCRHDESVQAGPWGLLAQITGAAASSVYRWRDAGLIDEQHADVACTALGLHGAMLWPVEWLADAC